jgi:hypothetical protein
VSFLERDPHMPHILECTNSSGRLVVGEEMDGGVWAGLVSDLCMAFRTSYGAVARNAAICGCD